jgi:hypothetical protein
MAEGTTKTEQPVERALEPVDVELRNPTVVLSMRLDDATARQLHRIAKRRGVRLSDVLREAAVAYAATESSTLGARVAIVGGEELYPVEVSLGNWPMSTADPYRARVGPKTLHWIGQQEVPSPLGVAARKHLAVSG